MSDVEWQHRWYVDAYWARRHCKDSDGSDIVRWVLVKGHVKGPEGKPLLVRPKISALVR